MEPDEYQLMDEAEDGMWWYLALHARVLDALRPHRAARGPVLDAGCGTGGFLARLRRARPAGTVAGLEFNPDAAARARAKAGAPVAVGSVNAVPFADAAFAGLVSLDVLCHGAAEPDRALAEFHRVLRPGGMLVLNLPAFQWLRSAHDVRVHTTRRFTAEEVRALLAKAGFAEVRTRYWNSLLFPLMVLQRKVLARGADKASDVALPPPWLNRSLHAATGLERRAAAAGLRFPAGGSVLATAIRP
ncbi:MAG: class I SAM-dependent methyltransferase [Acetobacteraceae bacterium]|nr:class I SAM-dependent methyltransferase [Acetobacteraceae bacterium]